MSGTYKIFLFLAFFLFSESSLAVGDVSGSFRLRSVFSQFETKSSPELSFQGRLHLEGNVRPSNTFKMQVHILSAYSQREEFSFREAFQISPSAHWLITEDLELRLGRNLYESEFKQIVSLNDYEPFFYVFDGAFLEYSTKILNVNFWGAYLPERKFDSKQIQDKYGFGFFLDIEPETNTIDYFNVHAVYLGDSLLESQSDNMSRYGLGLKGLITPFNLSYDFVAIVHSQAIQVKSSESVYESMYHFRLSYTYHQFFDSQIFAGYHTDSPQYKPWLYDRHIHSGFLDLFFWGNLSYYFAGFSLSADSLFDLKVSFYELSSADKGPVQVGYFGALLNPDEELLRVEKSQSLGRELDIQLEKEISESFKIHLLAGLFIPHLSSKDFIQGKDFYNNVQLTGIYKF